MKQKELLELTDQELLDEAKKMRKASIINASLIGFMIGIIIYSILKNTVGLFTLIPLFFIFKVFHKPEKNAALKKLLKERNLK
ncbi:FUSC family protein [uncultured Aquimarina sp.]|uniref:FUSC family protein n=1 Tax=uncultured Aquimarina sp. TaxID=575652 RepID=UPI00261C04AD|nr:FUSC family protein [uncultured Aquimarina sp.]